MRTAMRHVQTLALGGLAACLIGCGGDSGGSGREAPSLPAYTLASEAFRIDGTEHDLDTRNADAVLAAALAAATSAALLTSGDLDDMDDGAAPPGRGLFACSAGSISESVSADPVTGTRTVALATSQCFDLGSDGVQHGPVTLQYRPAEGGRVTGSLSFGSGGTSFAYALPAGDGTGHRLRQARGHFSFESDVDGASSHSTIAGLALLFGTGPRPFGAAALTPDRLMEVRAGADGFELSVDVDTGGGITGLDFGGRFFVAGRGIAQAPGCTFAAHFDAVTSTPLSLGAEDGVVRGGRVTLSSAAGTATVGFDSTGEAQVDTGTGTPVIYPAAIVRDFCGIGPA